MAVLKYKDPNTGQWEPLAGVSVSKADANFAALVERLYAEVARLRDRVAKLEARK